jgi:hypothetical protein
MLSAEAKPLLFVPTKLAECELTTLRVLWVVVVDLGMTFETERDRVPNSATGRRGGRLDVVNFDLHPAEAVTDAAPPMAGEKERLDVLATKLLPALTSRPKRYGAA